MKNQTCQPSLFKGMMTMNSQKVSWSVLFDLITRDAGVTAMTEQYRKLMEQGLSDAAQAIKRQCLAFTPAVECGASRKPEGFVGLTGVGLCDFDHVPNIEQAFALAQADPHAFMVYRTISGQGVRVLFRYTFTDCGTDATDCLDSRTKHATDNYADYQKAFECGNRYFAHLLQVPYDGQCKNVGRLSVIGHDAEAVFRDDCEVFAVSVEVPIEILDDMKTDSKTNKKSSSKTDKKIDNSKFSLARITKAVIQRLELDDVVYEPGNRNHYVSCLGYYLNRLGIAELKGKQWAVNQFKDLSATEVNSVIHSCYGQTEEHGVLALRKLERKNQKDSGKDSTAICSVEEIENFLASQAKFRVNVITRKVEFCMIDDGASDKSVKAHEHWAELTDRMVNSFWARLSKQDRKVRVQDVFAVINSEFTPEWNPFEDYFNHLPIWDGQTDYIAQLADMVHVKQEPNDATQEVAQERFRKCFRKWLVACVASLLEPAVVNNVIFVLVGHQGCYKTTFFSKLLPPELKQYFFTKTNSERMTKDDKITLAEYALMCLEELESMKSSELNQLKALVTDPVISERAAYARYKENRSHIASFCGTGNNKQFLTDQTGNRRWLPFEVDSIDNPFTHQYAYEGVYSQALALWKSHTRYWFDKCEIDELINHLSNFEVANLEEELITTYFYKPGIGDQTLLLNASNIIEYVGTHVKQHLSTVKIGIAMKKLGFECVRKSNGRFYKVAKYPLNMIEQNQREDANEELPF